MISQNISGGSLSPDDDESSIGQLSPPYAKCRAAQPVRNARTTLHNAPMSVSALKVGNLVKEDAQCFEEVKSNKVKQLSESNSALGELGSVDNGLKRSLESGQVLSQDMAEAVTVHAEHESPPVLNDEKNITKVP